MHLSFYRFNEEIAVVKGNIPDEQTAYSLMIDDIQSRGFFSPYQRILQYDNYKLIDFGSHEYFYRLYKN